jgi:hypothetical protein
VVEHVVEEEVPVQALALKASLHVGEGDDDGVDVPGEDVGSQLVDREPGRA